ncbi:MAG: RDD family protein [Gammaproteobacteria bacterium]|nr:RDD family protein [Gammaproteobacteria bacterium]
MQEQDVEYAGFWIRVGATIIDTLLILLLTLPLLVAIYGWDYFDVEKTGFIAGATDFILTWVAPAIAVIVFWMYKQATPGKMALSIRIVDATTGSPPSAGQCVGRYFSYYVSIIPVAFGLIWVGFDRRKQGWHDKLAGTVVIRSKERGPDPVTFARA